MLACASIRQRRFPIGDSVVLQREFGNGGVCLLLLGFSGTPLSHGCQVIAYEIPSNATNQCQQEKPAAYVAPFYASALILVHGSVRCLVRSVQKQKDVGGHANGARKPFLEGFHLPAFTGQCPVLVNPEKRCNAPLSSKREITNQLKHFGANVRRERVAAGLT